MKKRRVEMIEVSEWDLLVKEAYGRPYSFQQQDDCKPRGTHSFVVPDNSEDFKNEAVPEIVNGDKRGVSFSSWQTRDPDTPLKGDPEDPRYKSGKYPRTQKWEINLWWERNFYPEFQMIANDLHAKGLLEAGEYVIDIDW